MSEYLFPVKGGRVTTGFYDPRPYSLPRAQRKRVHGAWDIAGGDKVIRAPEDGQLYFHAILRSGRDKTNSLTWPDGLWYIFSNFFIDNYGFITVLSGVSGKVYLFAHQDMLPFFESLNSRLDTEWAQHRYMHKRDYNDWVDSFVNLSKGVDVKQGDHIGMVGNTGYSTGPHVHMQIHSTWDTYDSKIDPAELWRDVRIYDNGDGPKYGPK